jgi:hypothetical protein
MRKLLIISIVGLISAAGCCDSVEMLRRVEIWKLQNILAPAQQPMAVTSGNPCGTPVAPAAGCPCPPGAAPGVVSTQPAAAAVSAGYPEDSGETVSTEELDGVLKQP